MSAPAFENQILELEEMFYNVVSFKNSVKAAGGEIVPLDRKLWDASPVLKKHLIEGDSYLKLNVPAIGVSAMMEAYRNDFFPTNFPILLHIFAAATQLELQNLAHRCFNELRQFVFVDYPVECSTEVVMLVFKKFVESPLRTTSIYEHQLKKIAAHCRDSPDVMIEAMNLIKQKVEQFNQLKLEPIMFNFHRGCLSIAILKRQEKLYTAVLEGKIWKPVELFGKYFDLEACKVEDYFYLKYGSYVLFKSDEIVYRKKLRADAYIEIILHGCTYFLTRENFTFAVVKRENLFHVLRWINDNEFVSIYSSEDAISFIEFYCNERTLAIRLNPDKIRFFYLVDQYLTFTGEWYLYDCIAIEFRGQERFFYKRQTDNWKLARLQYQPLDKIFTEGVTVGSGVGHLKMSAGNTFVLDEYGCNLVETFPQLYSTLPPGELQSLSELYMSI